MTNPKEIAKMIISMNESQYHQAHDTPFGSGPLANSIGWWGTTVVSQNLLKGVLPTSLLNTLMPDTVKILNTLATPTFATITSSDSITPAKFISAYKVTPENKSTSLSGRHVSHYKAILKMPYLVSLHTTMVSIPFRTGMINPRWSRVMDIMLPKDENHSRYHHLCIIALFESDYN
jgi:hypothetical protein